ncbi:MAG: hypothetical protein ABI276_00810 [Acidimicrobiales bacterium]
MAILEDERTFLLASLADLEREHDVGDLDKSDYETLRDGYTVRAAEVLRAIEERREAIAPAKPGRPLRLAVGGAAVVVLAVLAGVWVAHTSGSRKGGQTITGNAQPTQGVAPGGTSRGSGAAPSSAASACIQQITAKPLDALKCFDKVLAKSPNDAMAMTYRGWTLTLVSQSAPAGPDKTALEKAAEGNLTTAITVAPDLADAHVFLAILLTNTGRCDQARAELAKIDALHLPPGAMVAQLVDSRLRPKLANGACPPPT